MLYKYLLKLNIKCYVIFICFFLINILQAQDCSSLRKPNETYGAGEGKDVSWCNMQNPTAYTDCMCEQEKSQKVSAVEQQNLQKQALNKSTEASALYQQASNLVTQANLDKDPSKLDEAKALYQQAITLSNQAKGFIEQAYAGSDASYNRLKNLYMEQYNKQIAWATTGIEGIPNQKDRIKAETNQKQVTLNPKKSNTANNWDLSKDPKAEDSLESHEISTIEKPRKEGSGIESWTLEETINWIENNLFPLYFKSWRGSNNKYYISEYKLLTESKFTINGEGKERITNISLGCFKNLKLIDIAEGQLGITFHFSEKCVHHKTTGYLEEKREYFTEIFDPSKFDYITKEDKKEIVNVIIHLAVLNGANKDNIEINN
ncbi:hypothetical protein [Winogradskyella sp.]|uniref:hypothetical protein n=1 Tax=Winogradskyella sp. TaxID=1883156 RepID=UPI003AB5432A